jgi:Xaa-Pro dipeptidase
MTVDLSILEGKYPAKAHARRVKDWIIANGGDGSGVLYLEGQKQKYNEVRKMMSPYDFTSLCV